MGIGGFQPISALGPYSVSKTALLGLTKALATETAADNIRVNCVAPGVVRTKFASALTRMKTSLTRFWRLFLLAGLELLLRWEEPSASWCLTRRAMSQGRLWW